VEIGLGFHLVLGHPLDTKLTPLRSRPKFTLWIFATHRIASLTSSGIGGRMAVEFSAGLKAGVEEAHTEPEESGSARQE
jgi:hypothetical protein